MFLEYCTDDLTDIVWLGHSIIMYGGETVIEEVAALLDGPVYACLIGIFGGLCLLQKADERLRNVNVKASRKQVNLLLRRDGLQAGDDGNGDASLSAEVNKAEELLVVEEHLRHDIVRSSLYLLSEVLNVGLKVGGLEVFLGISSHTDAEVGGKSLFDRRVEICAAIQVANHRDEFRTVAEAVGFGYEMLLSWQRIASQSHDIVDAKEVKIKQFAFYVTA